MVLFLKNGMGVPHLTQENMKSVKIQLPPLNEQQEIVKYLDSKCADIDALIALRQDKIDTLKEYKKSLIFEYVTGKKQVV
jgi:type I restriction enzyme S subunit